jgi:tetratricopeptide (TPR) repeat protein
MTATAVLDDQTARVIREALSAAGRGQLRQACAIGDRALANGGDAVALNALLGMLRRQAGELEASINHLRIAHAGKPADLKIATNLANALADAGSYTEALEVISDNLARSDRSMQLERLRGFLAQSADDFEQAVKSYERVVAAYPADWEALNNLGNARRCTGDLTGCIAALERAAEIEPDAPPIRLNLAVAIGVAGDIAESERRLRCLADELPTEPQPLRALHALLKEQLRDDEALNAIEEAVRRAPKDMELRLALASHLSEMHRYEAAEEAYLKAIDLRPSTGQASLGLAFVYEITNQTEKLFNLMSEVETRGIGVAGREFIRAFGFRRQKRYDEGLKSLEQVPDTMESPRRFHLLGQMLQGAGRHDEAFAAFERMNALNRDDPSGPELRGANYRTIVQKQCNKLSESWLSNWRTTKIADGQPLPVFLVGFPRSGTTLLDTMLMGHPRIEVLEEEPTMRLASAQFPDFDSLQSASDQLIQKARNIYFDTARSLTPLEPGHLLVDKNPLTMNALPFIHRMFPGAKIVCALRHPCDVVLSCFITNFRANDGMSSFLHLDSAAHLYDLSFSYFERAQRLMKFPMHTVVYERIIADRERELKALFQFLGLEWHERVLDHETIAKGRGRIKTASYSQVVEPIYTRASGRWWNYRKHLEPIFPVLEPWIGKFGYSLDDPTKYPGEPLAL